MPEGTRTPDLQLRRLLLYPVELQAYVRKSIKRNFVKGCGGGHGGGHEDDEVVMVMMGLSW